MTRRKEDVDVEENGQEEEDGEAGSKVNDIRGRSLTNG
jgi:hypothetical protein